MDARAGRRVSLDTSAGWGSADEFAENLPAHLPEAFGRPGGARGGVLPEAKGGTPTCRSRGAVARRVFLMPAHAPLVGGAGVGGRRASRLAAETGSPRRRTTNSQLIEPGSRGCRGENRAMCTLSAPAWGSRGAEAPNDSGVMPVVLPLDRHWCVARGLFPADRSGWPLARASPEHVPRERSRPQCSGAVARPSLARSGKAGLARPSRPRCVETRRHAETRRVDAGLPTGLASRSRGVQTPKGVHFLAASADREAPQHSPNYTYGPVGWPRINRR
jgi:hypothetical protein